MADGDDGYSEVGGGGSVAWAVKVRSGNVVETARINGTWGYTVKDTDDLLDQPTKAERRALYDKFFKVTIQEPRNGKKIVQRRENGARVFYVPIEPRRRQIRVRWAFSDAAVRAGGKTRPKRKR